MAKAKIPETGLNDLVANLVHTMNRAATGTEAYLAGDHANHTWGVAIPYLAAQWMMGGTTIFPMQRYTGISAVEKSFKSTLQVEIGNWCIMAGGAHIHLDPENKTSAGMLDAMSWWNGVDEKKARVYKACRSVGEWQTMVTKLVESAREAGARPKGHRQPLYIVIDGLTSRATEGQMENLVKEGQAAERGFPLGAAATTTFLESLNLLGTTIGVGWVQHMKEAIEQTGHGTVYKEKGPKASQFACSTHLRLTRAHTPVRAATHPGAPRPDLPVEGYTLYVKNVKSSIGPADRVLPLDILWQHVPQPDGTTRQAMWFDWHTALGELLHFMKYDKKAPLYASEKERLDEALKFTEGAKASEVKCAELKLVDASFYEFGAAIANNPEVRKRVSSFLNIREYPDVQTADIDFEAGDKLEKKGGK